MRTHRNHFPALFISVMVCLLVGGNTALCSDYINYRLLPESTFTPKYDGIVTGPAEALTGTFQWHYEKYFLGNEIFKVTSLHFESASYALNLSPTNNTGFTIWGSSNLASIYAEVYTTGTAVPAGVLIANGTYSGSCTSPTSLTYPAIDIYPVGGGLYYGRLTLYAEQVPEPATILLFGLGALTLSKRR